MAFSEFGQGDDLDDWSRKVQDIMDEMQQRSFVHFRDAGTWQPATDVYETRQAYYVCVELAGMSPEAVDVECLDPRRLSISGHRGSPRPTGETGPLSVHVMEIDHGPFRREVTLPEPINVDAVEATYDKGYLWITLRKSTTR